MSTRTVRIPLPRVRRASVRLAVPRPTKRKRVAGPGDRTTGERGGVDPSARAAANPAPRPVLTRRRPGESVLQHMDRVRDVGLAQPIGADNVGYRMLQRMGWRPPPHDAPGSQAQGKAGVGGKEAPSAAPDAVPGSPGPDGCGAAGNGSGRDAPQPASRGQRGGVSHASPLAVVVKRNRHGLGQVRCAA